MKVKKRSGMITLNLFDSNFPGQECSVANQTPQTCRYVRNRTEWEGVTLFTDGQMYSPIVDAVKSTYKIGWLHEYYDLHPENYDRAYDVLEKFDAILTTEPYLWQSENKFWPYIRGGTWVKPEKWAVYPKTKRVAMIVSDKNFCPGHKLRHVIAKQFAHEHIDFFGPSFTPIGTDKEQAFKDYQFAIVVEPARREGAFAEHLLDPMAFGTVPLYWGCPNIGQFFDQRGILSFSDIDGLDALLRHIHRFPDELYNRMLPAIHRNLKKVADYAITDDWIVENVLRPNLGLK